MFFSTMFSGKSGDLGAFLIDLPESLLRTPDLPVPLGELSIQQMSGFFLSFPPFFMEVHQLMFRIRLKVPEGEN